MLRIFLSLWLAFTPALSWAGSMSLMGVGRPSAAAPVGPPAYTYIGQANNASSGTTVSQSFALGSNPSCTVVVEIVEAGVGSATFTATVGGVSLVQDSYQINTAAARTSAVFSKPLTSCSGSQLVTVNATVAYDLTIWVNVLTGLSSSTSVASGGYVISSGTLTPTAPTVDVTAGDLMFIAGSGNSSVPLFTNYTQVPTTRAGFDGLGVAADQTILATNPSFSTAPPGAESDEAVAIATYH